MDGTSCVKNRNNLHVFRKNFICCGTCMVGPMGHRIIEQAVSSSRVNSTLKLFISGLVHDLWHHLGFFFQFYLMLAVTVNAIKIKGSK